MTSVALQLFSERINLAYNHGNLCITFAFVGIGILGISFALTAGWTQIALLNYISRMNRQITLEDLCFLSGLPGWK